MYRLAPGGRAGVRLLVPSLVSLSIAVACSNNDQGTNLTNPPNLTRVVVSPKTATLAAGAKQQFSAYGRDSAGDSVGASVDFTAAGGAITSTGLFTAGNAAGSFDVVATEHGGTLADTATVTVTVTGPPVLAQVVLRPSSATVVAGGTKQFTAYGRMSNGDSATIPITYSATGGTISASGIYSAGQTTGSYQVIASDASGAFADTSAVIVTSAGLAQVILSPATAALIVGGTQQFGAYGKNGAGDSIAVAVHYSATGGMITAAGLYTAGQTAGAFQVIAVDTSGKYADTAAVSIVSSIGGIVFVGAGDISDCGNDNDEATAKLLDAIPGTVFTLGDNVYSSGTDTQYAQCFDPTWGRHKARTKPSPGNHDYNTSGATGYYNYWGALAGPAGRGYYSFDLGSWHIISLNSEVSMSAGGAEETWLRADLAATTQQCILAYWHKPRFSSGTNHGSLSSAQPLWQALYDFHADLILNGHEHNYERFAPQSPTGAADPTNGIREIVSGTGGESHYNDEGTPLANSEIFNGTTYGVLELTLGSGTYSWQFIPVAGQSFTDSGTGTCH
jgi:calcineurin-like phosphoesterase family protein